MASKEILELKQQQVEEIKNKISTAKGLVIIDYMGLNVAQDTAFRKEMRNAGVDYQVLKNRLVQRAFNELGFTQFDEALNGPTAVAFSSTDATSPAKVVFDNIKKLNKMSIKCGMLDGKYVDEATVQALSKVPNKETLLAMLLSVLQAPIRGLAVALNEIAKKAE